MTDVAAAEAVRSPDLRAVAASLGAAPVGPPPARAPAGPARLGEELPIFCEQCGYALHGLPQRRCERCTILHFACPECGHHQPINTLRPAAQRVLGRLRAFVLGLWVLFKINFFGWLLFAWFAMGMEWSYQTRAFRDPVNPNNWIYTAAPRPVDLEASVAFCVFALLFGMFGRMFLLRWRRGWAVGAVLGALVALAVWGGTVVRVLDLSDRRGPIAPLGVDFQLLLLGTAATILFGAVAVWPIWLAIVHLFLPTRTAAALLQWQRSMSAGAPALARQQ